MNLRRTIVWSSLRYHMRMNIAVAAGVAAATAVIVGALLVGESMRGSLRDMTLDRLGKFDEVLLADRFFRVELAEELAQTSDFDKHFSQILPVIYFAAGTAEDPDPSGLSARRTSNIQILGITPEFWEQSRSSKTIPDTTELTNRQVILNQPLADNLKVKKGDRITLRLPAGDDVPPESTLAQKTDRVLGLAGLEVVAILPAEGLGRFSLHANQALPMAAFVNLAALQARLDEPDRCNALFVASEAARPKDAGHEWLSENLRWTPDDLGLHIRRHQLDSDGEPNEGDMIFDYYSVTSDRMLLEDEVAAVVEKVAGKWGGQTAITYLADTIATKSNVATDPSEIEGGIPYSMVTGVDSTPAFPYLPAGEQLADNEIAINSITAEQLGIALGDAVSVYYLEPESSHGEAAMAQADFTVKVILPLTEPIIPYDELGHREFTQPPTRFNDPALTPEVEGITDQESIGEWKAPFPGYDRRRIKDPDELYWDNHRTTPRAIVSLASGQRLWGSRFGKVTSVMIPAGQLSEDDIRSPLIAAVTKEGVGAKIGLSFRAVKQEGLDASSGTTPFDGLFLGLSFFIIFAAVVLVSILFRLGIEQRYQDVGLLSALGLDRPDVMKLFVREGLWVSSIGSLIGVPLGLAYGAMMIAGLRTLWVGAIGTQFLRTHITWLSPTLGLLSGIAVSAIVIYFSIRYLKHRTTRSLLAGHTDATAGLTNARPAKWLSWTAIVAIVSAVAVGVIGTRLSGEPQALAFIGSGAMLLAALTTLAWIWLRQPGGSTMTIVGLAVSNAKRNATRSGMTIGLVATASFLILAMSAMRLAPNEQGSGGFRWLARSSAPIFGDLHSPATRIETLGTSQVPGDAEIYSLRVKPGDDASCRNLYQSTQPQVYGVTDAFIQRYDSDDVSFGWAKHGPVDDSLHGNPWRLLLEEPNEDAIPVIVDNNTAMYSLHWYGGVGAEYDVEYDDGQTIRVQVVALLANSVLQGALVMSEENFTGTFPKVSGYRLFLVAAPKSDSNDDSQETDEELVAFLEEGLSEQGFDLTSTVSILDDLLAVQNTYLSAFQSLGALGLIFGVFGLAAVQLRNVFERRKELALMRAQGFAKSRLGRLVFIELFLLLSCGLGVGVVSALAAVLPHMFSAGVQPPFAALGAWLLVILVTGMLAGVFAVRRTISAPVVSALRGE
jgi:putative ABC transport system permease protein